MIAISGKGGTGKSTVAAMIIRWLREHLSSSILAVDADPNANLNELLGVEARETIGAIREEMKEKVGSLSGGMTKQRFLEYKIQSSLVENADFDLIVMGRPEGPGCYCYANNLLREILKTLAENYDFVVIDNEAGMEHLSRRTVNDIDYLLILSDLTVRGVQTAGKISRLLKELETRVREKYLVLNRTHGALPEPVAKVITAEGLNLLHSIPEDKTLLQMDQGGIPIWDYLPNSPAYQAIDQMMKKFL